MRQGRNNQSGVMLLEVLVALLIFAIGILGLLGMQAVSIKPTADSKYTQKPRCTPTN